jgi:uncharacterized protein
MAVEMVVNSVHAHPLLPQRLLILHPAAAEGPGVCLLLVIGPAEADAIALRLLGEAPPRPLTHDLLCDLLRLLGGRVTHVLVHAAVAGTFYARVVLDAQGHHVEADARPSDAVALALRLGAPILVDEAVLAAHGVAPAAGAPAAEAPTGAERVRNEQLAAYREALEGLDLDDLGGQ